MSVMEIARVASVGVTTTLILGSVSWLGARLKPQVMTGVSGRVTPNRTVVALVLILGLGIAASAAYAVAMGTGGHTAAWVALAFVAASALLATQFSAEYDIEWDANGITGPTSYGLWPFGPSRARLTYDQIVWVGQDWAGSWCIEDDQGRRIRWSYIYAGYPTLMGQIEAMCPDLFDEG